METSGATQLRRTYGEALVELGYSNPKVVVVDADMAEGTMSSLFRERFPARFFDVGVAEQNLVGLGAGLSITGFIPFVNTFAWLLALRAADCVRTLVSYARTNVKLMAGYGGFSGAMGGATHHAITDLAVVRAFPGMTVVVASDHVQVRAMVPMIADFGGPVYLRLSRAEVRDIHKAETRFEIGRGCILRDGSDITLIGTGTLLSRLLDAADALEADGVRASVLEIHTLKPLDTELVLDFAARTHGVVTYEEHNIIGGLGSAVAEVLSEHEPVPLERVGIRDCYGQTGPYDKLLSLYGLGVDDVLAAAKRVLSRKERGLRRAVS